MYAAFGDDGLAARFAGSNITDGAFDPGWKPVIAPVHKGRIHPDQERQDVCATRGILRGSS